MEYLNNNQQNNIDRQNNLNIDTNFQILRNRAYESRNNNTLDRNKRITEEEAYNKYPILDRIIRYKAVFLGEESTAYGCSREHFLPNDINLLLQQNIQFFNEYSTTTNQEVLKLFEEAWNRILYAVSDKFSGKSTPELYRKVVNLVQNFLPAININNLKYQIKNQYKACIYHY